MALVRCSVDNTSRPPPPPKAVVSAVFWLRSGNPPKKPRPAESKGIFPSLSPLGPREPIGAVYGLGMVITLGAIEKAITRA